MRGASRATSGALVVVSVVALVVLDAWVGGARAQAPIDPVEEEARLLFERGRELAEARRFGEAAEAFRASRARVERPSTVFNLALCLFALERHRDSIEALEAFLRAPELDPGSIQEAERMLAHARSRLGTLVLELDPADARVTVDGALLEGGAHRRLSVDPGPHVVRVEARDHATRLLQLSVAPGREALATVRLESTRVPAVLVVRPEPADARVRIDGRDVDGAVELPPGAHRVEVWHPTRWPAAREVELAEGARLEVSLAAGPPVESSSRRGVWIGVAAGVVAVVAGALAVGLATRDPRAPNGGSLGVVLEVP